MAAPPHFVLASGSPRRRELLGRFGVPFEVVSPRVDEVPLQDERPADYALRTAGDKGREVAGRTPEGLVLSADTVVSVHDRILGKPVDLQAAREMLQSLEGRVHYVYTAVVFLDSRTGETLFEVDETRVWFSELSRAEIETYVNTESVMDKAGAYGIQGSASGFIPGISGNYSNVMGLPLPVVFDFLIKTGILSAA